MKEVNIKNIVEEYCTDLGVDVIEEDGVRKATITWAEGLDEWSFGSLIREMKSYPRNEEGYHVLPNGEQVYLYDWHAMSHNI